MIWFTVNPRVDLGLLPSFFSLKDPRPAKAQIHERYLGGWHAMAGCGLTLPDFILTYPGDPPMKPIAWAKLRQETILLYPSAWVAIVQPDGSFEVDRID